MNLQSYLARRQQRVDRFLERCIPPSNEADTLTQAMRYSLFSGGKRLRPILSIAATEAVGGTVTPVLPFACALELIHTYSLIHDDLPAMDDDDLRRGQPTSHRVFGEGMAILAGDALLTEAFRIMAEAVAKPAVSQRRALQVLTEIASAAGARGMVAGQADDLGAEDRPINLPIVEWIHIRKTGALIRAADTLRRVSRSGLPDRRRHSRCRRHGGLDRKEHRPRQGTAQGDVSGGTGSPRRERTRPRVARQRHRGAAWFQACCGTVAGDCTLRRGARLFPLMRPKHARIDKLLVDRGLVGSRDRARRLVMSGAVWIADRRVDKPGAVVPVDAALVVRGADMPFVSRGGLKLDGALSHWEIDVRGLVAVDIGASTGGFTDCLLQRGARHVFAIDVGYGQFAWKLRQDRRVTLFERANIRSFAPAQLPQLADLAVIDVSFISLRLVLPVAIGLVRPDGTILALVKPQFEVGKGEVGKGGVVRDPTQRLAIIAAVRTFGIGLGLSCGGDYPSPILGPQGNQECFLYFTLAAHPSGAPTASPLQA
jgi:23S rRNA (cytidine1920-2'-O)/16S rRNA (cytidine1409-2'-O)-methyltransferase